MSTSDPAGRGTSPTTVPDPELAEADQAPAPVAPAVPAASPGSFSLTLVVAAVVLYLTWGTVTMEVPATATPPGPRFFPTIVVALGWLLVVLLALQAWRGRRAAADSPAPARVRPAGAAVAGEASSSPGAVLDDDGQPRPPADWRAVAVVIATFAVFVVALEPVGWLLSGTLLFWGVAVGLGSRRHLFDVGIALVVSSVVQLAFSAGLGLNLPAGVLGVF